MCPTCGVMSASGVAKTLECRAFNQRWRRCKCGSQWLTEERVVKGSVKAITGSLMVANGPPVDRGLSLVSGSDPISSLPSLSNPDPERAHVKAPRRAKKILAYPQAFEGFWAACDSNRSKGLKAEALEAWRAAGEPDCVMLAEKWTAYRIANGETLCKDVCRWIKWGGHLQDYGPAPPPMRASGGGKTSGNEDMALSFMRREGLIK